jgi:uncharacterized protein YjiS (DUF1127 family)
MTLHPAAYYSGSPFPAARDRLVTCAAYLLSIVIGKEITMSSKQHRNLRAKPADVEALESLRHMTSWSRQAVMSPEAAPMQSRSGERPLGSMIDGFALGATAFYHGPWTYPIDGIGEADIEREAGPRRPSLAARAMQAIGGVAMRSWRGFQARREISRATAALSQMDDRSLQDIGLSRADIGRATRHGRDWERWR